MAKVPAKTKANDDTGKDDAGAVPHGATYLAGLHDQVKAMCKHMDEEGAAQDHEDVKALHGRMRKSLDEHLDDIKSTFAKAYPDVEGLEDEEEEEEGEGEKSAKARRKAAGRALKVKAAAAGAGALPASGLQAVQSAGDFLAELAAGGNLTPTQKAALQHHAGALKSAAAPADESDPEELRLLEQLVAKAQARFEQTQAQAKSALGLK